MTTLRVNDLVHLRKRRGYYCVTAIDLDAQLVTVVPTLGFDGTPSGATRTIPLATIREIAGRGGRRVKE